MRTHWPLLLLLLIPMAMFPGAIPGPETVSANDHLSVHHAYQSSAGGRVRNPHLSDPALQFNALLQKMQASSDLPISADDLRSAIEQMSADELVVVSGGIRSNNPIVRLAPGVATA